jgi:glycosyltransferase involved in cell wall biosynthesis
MKVLFTFSGMPHYLSALLNKLNNEKHIEVVVVIPQDKSKSIGRGVKLVNNKFGYKIIQLKEYNSAFSKPFFKDFYTTVVTESPDLIVIGWPYILPLSLHFRTIKYIKRKKIGLIFREIPFSVAPYKQAIRYYKNNPILDDDLNIMMPKGIKFYLWAITLNYIRKWYYSLVDATIAYSIDAYSIHKSFGLKKEQIFVSCNSPDTEKLLSIKNKIESVQSIKKYNPFRLIHVGRLVKWKRVEMLIDVTIKLVNEFSESELVIIGTGPEEHRLREKVISAGVENKIVFFGSIYEENLAEYFMSSGIYVLAGMGGLSINEAMAFGKPVICSVCDGTEKTLVREGYNGLYFNDGDADSLFEKIKYLYQNLHLIDKMGKNSEKIIKDEVNLNTVTDVFLQAFNYVYKLKAESHSHVS